MIRLNPSVGIVVQLRKDAIFKGQFGPIWNGTGACYAFLTADVCTRTIGN